VWLPELAWFQEQLGLQNSPARTQELAAYLKQLGFHGPGKYLIPLVKTQFGKVNEYAIVRIPQFGRFPSPPTTVELPPFPANAEAWPSLAGASCVGSVGAALGPASLLGACVSWPHRIDPDKVVEILSDGEGVKKEEVAMKRAAAAEMVAGWKRSKQPVVIARRWSPQDARFLQRKLLRAGVVANLIEEAVRIYPWTPEAQTQVQAIIAAKR
jgi:hypothetical protein